MRADEIARFLDAVGDRTELDAVVPAFAQHLAATTADALPAPAQTHWRDVARLLRSPADKPIPERAVAAIRSWPAARVAELLAHIRKLDEILEALENQRLEDEIRDSIRRHYL